MYDLCGTHPNHYLSSTTTGTKQKRVVHVSQKSISTQARKQSATHDVCETKPLYMHWFGLEVHKAYELAKSKIEKKYPIKVTLNDSTHEIDQKSLQNATGAIKSICTLHDDKTNYPNYRRLMSSSALCSTELAITSLLCRALDHFIFTDETIGACLHQAPCRKKNVNSTDVERPDVYILPFCHNDECAFLPGNPVLLSDIKTELEFDHADRESALYSAVGVKEGDCLQEFPVLIACPSTIYKMQLQLHVNIENKFWKLVVADSEPYDAALLCTLKAATLHLIEHNMFATKHPSQRPMPFKDMQPYSIYGLREQVFLNKESNTIFKFFDTRVDDFYHPNVKLRKSQQYCRGLIGRITSGVSAYTYL